MENMTPYYIQRATFSNRPREGVDGVLEFDYMGSSEFEFGAIGNSLKRIRSATEKYTLAPVCDPTPITKSELLMDNTDKPVLKSVFGQKLMLYCKESDREQIIKHIMGLKANKIRLKESSYFEAHFDPKSVPPGFAEVKRKAKRLHTRHGEMVYRDIDGNTYRVDQKTKRVKSENEYQLRTNCWWDIGHDWIMFFELDGRGNRLVHAIENPVPKPATA